MTRGFRHNIHAYLPRIWRAFDAYASFVNDAQIPAQYSRVPAAHMTRIWRVRVICKWRADFGTRCGKFLCMSSESESIMFRLGQSVRFWVSCTQTVLAPTSLDQPWEYRLTIYRYANIMCRGPIVYIIHYFTLMYKFCTLFVHYWSLHTNVHWGSSGTR